MRTSVSRLDTGGLLKQHLNMCNIIPIILAVNTIPTLTGQKSKDFVILWYIGLVTTESVS